MIWKHSRKLQGNEKGGLTAPTANPRKMGKPTHGIRRVYHLPSQTATILIKKEREDMYKITIQYHAPDNVKLSKLLMAAILKVIEQNSMLPLSCSISIPLQSRNRTDWTAGRKTESQEPRSSMSLQG